MAFLKLKRKEDAVRLFVFCVFHVFNLISMIIFGIKWLQGTATFTQVLYCILTVLYCSIPDIAQKLCKFRIATPAYILILFYAFSPMLGHTYGLYYSIKIWDKLLHVAAGIIFAMFGAYLPKFFLKDEKCNIWLCVLCGFAVSMAIAGLWELVEYFFDSFFHTDMQKDTIIYRLDSYLLNEELYGASGELLTLPAVSGTVIDGAFIEGYLDVGRQDSMIDMLVELAGTLLFCIVYLIDKGKRFAFHYIPSEEQKE